MSSPYRCLRTTHVQIKCSEFRSTDGFAYVGFVLKISELLAYGHVLLIPTHIRGAGNTLIAGDFLSKATTIKLQRKRVIYIDGAVAF